MIDHGPQKVATFYTHMSKLFVTPTDRAKSGQRVYAGQPIGIIDFDPRDGQRLKHLRFELWLGGPKDAVDVAPIIKSWEYIKDPRPSSPPPKTMTVPGPMVAHNASLQYRPIGARGEPYPEWVRALDGKSGVYVIREIDASGTPEVVYVGSSQARLYDTMTRLLSGLASLQGVLEGPVRRRSRSGPHLRSSPRRRRRPHHVAERRARGRGAPDRAASSTRQPTPPTGGRGRSVLTPRRTRWRL